MSHYLLTGAAGFIGQKVAEMLVAAGHTVTGLDNLNDSYDVRLKQWRLERLQSCPGFRFRQIDITDRAGLAGIFAAAQQAEPFAAVFNLAARAGVRYSVENPWVYLETNVTGTLNLLELCRQHGINKFILSSTSSLYGSDTPLPFHEDACCDHPLSPYAASKRAAEAMAYSYHHLYGLDITVFRYFTVYGPAGRPDMMPFRLVQWISEGRSVTVYGDGTQSRDFTYVDDIARGTIAGLKPLGYEVINLGSDQPAVLNDVIRLVEQLTSCSANIRRLPMHAADVKATWASIAKARTLLGWQPEATLMEGFSALVAWYRTNQSWAREIATA